MVGAWIDRGRGTYGDDMAGRLIRQVGGGLRLSTLVPGVTGSLSSFLSPTPQVGLVSV